MIIIEENNRKHKKEIAVIKKIIFFILTVPLRYIIFLAVFLIYHVMLSGFFSTDENNMIHTPVWYIFLGIGLSITAAILYKPGFLIKRIIKNFQSDDDAEPDCIIAPKEKDIEPIINTIPQQQQIDEPKKLNSASIIEQIDKMDGHVFEYWCADLLAKNGFDDVQVTKGSGDQGVDILAVKDEIRYAIQCKNYSSDLGNKPIQEVNTGRIIYNCQIGAVITNRYFTKGAVEAAQATGVLLWDRGWILRHIKEENQSEIDPFYYDCVEYVSMIRRADVQTIINRFHIGYARAARLIDAMEENGVVGPFRGSKPREVLIKRNY